MTAYSVLIGLFYRTIGYIQRYPRHSAFLAILLLSGLTSLYIGLNKVLSTIGNFLVLTLRTMTFAFIGYMILEKGGKYAKVIGANSFISKEFAQVILVITIALSGIAGGRVTQFWESMLQSGGHVGLLGFTILGSRVLINLQIDEWNMFLDGKFETPIIYLLGIAMVVASYIQYIEL